MLIPEPQRMCHTFMHFAKSAELMPCRTAGLLTLEVSSLLAYSLALHAGGATTWQTPGRVQWSGSLSSQVYCNQARP